MRSTAVAMTWLVTLAAILPPAVASPFATTWWFFEPAPGQFVNNAIFNYPFTTLGAPDGAGTEYGNVNSVLSLGGFGGSVVLGFDHLVEDDPRNPFGLDAIVFGNATWIGGDPDRHWAECAVIEIALDANDDGLPNDPWYLIPGSHITDLDGQFVTQTWDDDSSTATPPAILSWVPDGMFGEWETSGYLLDPAVFGSQVVENPISTGDEEGIYGYGDFTPTLMLGDLDADDNVDDEEITPEAFYTVPDATESSGIVVPKNTVSHGDADIVDVHAAAPSVGSEKACVSVSDYKPVKCRRVCAGYNMKGLAAVDISGQDRPVPRCVSLAPIAPSVGKASVQPGAGDKLKCRVVIARRAQAALIRPVRTMGNIDIVVHSSLGQPVLKAPEGVSPTRSVIVPRRIGININNSRSGGDKVDLCIQQDIRQLP